MPITINGSTGISGVDGSAATPALQGGDTNTGIAFGTDIILASTGGVERYRVDPSGRLLVGTSTARSNFFNTASSAPQQFQVEGTSGNACSLASICSVADTSGGRLLLAHQRSGSVGGNTILNSGDQAGYITFQGNDGGEFVECASIEAVIDGTPGSNDMPGRLVFSTTADGASSPTERWRIDAAGSLIGAAGSALLAPENYNLTTANAANVNIDSGGLFRRSTSSSKYKTDIEALDDTYANAILQCRPVWYRSTCDADKPEWGYWGFIAEEVAAIDPRLCFFEEKEDGSLEPEGVQYDRFVPHLLNLIKRQKEQIEAMEVRLSALEAS